jgi:hypothetical protein
LSCVSTWGLHVREAAHLRGSEREPFSQSRRKSAVGDSAEPVLQIRIRIRIRIHRIHVFLGLQDLDPDPLVRCMDPDPDLALDPDPDPSIIMQNCKRILDSYYFVTLFEFFSLKNDVNVASKSHKQKKLC